MTGKPRLSRLDGLSADVRIPDYTPQAHKCGIVHIGLGAFHKAHQAVYTDDALAHSGGDWRIIGISLRSPDAADALTPQNGLYTLLERSGHGTSARVIGSISHAIAASEDRQAALDALTSADTKIISLTVTEKAYGILRDGGTVDPEHPAIRHDLANPQAPEGVLGYLVRALQLRRAKGLAPVTVLCCDNLPENGKLLKTGILDFARRIDTELADWIAETIPFPSTMVDRITPASTGKTFADAARLIGMEDAAAIETEPFTQWVIEDDFASGRPQWEAGGAIFTDDVTPFENMKLRMLNGSHSMMAYTGFLSGKKYIRDVMADDALRALVERHLKAAAATLQPLSGIDFATYADELMQRFANPAIAHETYQIAMDGSQKMPQRIFAPARSALEAGQDIRPFAFASVAWMRYCLGRKDDGTSYALRDPIENAIHAAVQSAGGQAGEIVNAIFALPGLADKRLSTGPFRDQVVALLAQMLEAGIAVVLKAQSEEGRT